MQARPRKPRRAGGRAARVAVREAPVSTARAAVRALLDR